jgi:hypothetical protein
VTIGLTSGQTARDCAKAGRQETRWAFAHHSLYSVQYREFCGIEGRTVCALLFQQVFDELSELVTGTDVAPPTESVTARIAFAQVIRADDWLVTGRASVLHGEAQNCAHGLVLLSRQSSNEPTCWKVSAQLTATAALCTRCVC